MGVLRLSAALAAVAVVGAVAPGLASASTLVVGTDTTTCPAASFTSIQAAVDAASSGDTISVCPGTYNETVTIDKSVRLVGPGLPSDAGVLANCAQAATADPTTEAVWQNVNWIFRVQADDVSISGFVFQSPPGFNGQGTLVAAGFSGTQITGNVFQRAVRGMYFSSSGVSASNVSDNCFRALPGQGIALGTLSNTTFDRNAFSSVGYAFYSLTGGTSTNLTVENNAAARAQVFASIVNVQTSYFAGNSSTGGYGIALSGGNTSDLIASNTFTGGNAGITAAAGGAENTQIAIVGNTISEMSIAAITANPDHLTNSLIASNTVGNNAYGIWMQSGDIGNTIQNNVATGDSSYDCADDTSGSGTRGTGNTWRGNKGATSNPAGLCH